MFFISQIKGAGCKIILWRCSEWRVVCLFLPPKRVLGIVAIWVKMGGAGCAKRVVCKIDKKMLTFVVDIFVDAPLPRGKNEPTWQGVCDVN